MKKEVSIYTTVILPEVKTIYKRPPQIVCASRKQCLIFSVYVSTHSVF